MGVSRTPAALPTGLGLIAFTVLQECVAIKKKHRVLASRTPVPPGFVQLQLHPYHSVRLHANPLLFSPVEQASVPDLLLRCPG